MSQSSTTLKYIRLDRLTICFTDLSDDNVKGTCDLLMSDHIAKAIPGMIMTFNGRYKVRIVVPMPFMSDAVVRHPICFEAGPKLPNLSSYRLDINPAQLSSQGSQGMEELKAFLHTIMDPTPEEFFSQGKVTRIDAAVDLPDHLLDDLIVLSARMQKHGVYCDRYGVPETVYLGTPKSARVVAYTKRDKLTGAVVGTRIERRLKPRCLGKDIAALANPFADVKLRWAAVLKDALLGFPGQLVADSIRLRGLKRALAVLPAEQRKLITKILASSENLMPNTEELWAGWPDALVKVGLGEELACISHAE